MMKTLHTTRLTLRTLTPEDLEDFYEYAKNPHVGPSAGWKPHENREESLKILKSFAEEEDVWGIVMKSSNKVVGSIGLHRDRKRDNPLSRMMGYALSEDYWGRGLMTEAAERILRYSFEELDLQVVSVYHYPSNARSRRVIEKAGFTFEGTLRQASTLFDGKVVDDICYSITREEYLKK